MMPLLTEPVAPPAPPVPPPPAHNYTPQPPSGRGPRRSHGVRAGVLLVVVGIVLLAITTGFVGIEVVWRFLSLWPVLLIALGLELLGKSQKQPWVQVLAYVLVILTVAAAIAAALGMFSLPSALFSTYS